MAPTTTSPPQPALQIFQVIRTERSYNGWSHLPVPSSSEGWWLHRNNLPTVHLALHRQSGVPADFKSELLLTKRNLSSRSLLRSISRPHPGSHIHSQEWIRSQAWGPCDALKKQIHLIIYMKSSPCLPVGSASLYSILREKSTRLEGRERYGVLISAI